MKKAAHISEAGFSIVDMVVVVALIGVISAIALPTMTGAMDRMRLGQSARDVERELQSAKQRAIGNGRVMRVHFNCPTVREYRAVELIGTSTTPLAADMAVIDRCKTTGPYTFPAADNDPLTRPNLDGPVRWLDPSVSFGVVRSLEFRPDGTAYYDTGGGVWDVIPTTGTSLTVVRTSQTSTITVNGLGKIQLQ